MDCAGQLEETCEMNGRLNHTVGVKRMNMIHTTRFEYRIKWLQFDRLTLPHVASSRSSSLETVISTPVHNLLPNIRRQSVVIDTSKHASLHQAHVQEASISAFRPQNSPASLEHIDNAWRSQASPPSLYLAFSSSNSPNARGAT